MKMGRYHITLDQIKITIGDFRRFVVGEGVRSQARQNLDGIDKSEENK